MISFVKGDIFASDCKAIVIPVNCVGVMGAGLALEVKRRHFVVDNHYRESCKLGKVKIGSVLISSVLCGKDEHHPFSFIYFPTKYHFSQDSKVDYIKSGLDDLVRCIEDYKFPSVAIPALGCGLGRLRWEVVKPLIFDSMSEVSSNVEILIYEPLN